MYNELDCGYTSQEDIPSSTAKMQPDHGEP